MLAMTRALLAEIWALGGIRAAPPTTAPYVIAYFERGADLSGALIPVASLAELKEFVYAALPCYFEISGTQGEPEECAAMTNALSSLDKIYAHGIITAEVGPAPH